MGCRVEARFTARGGLLVREQWIWQGARLAAESLMAFPPQEPQQLQAPAAS
jgi:hypothetical protein